MQGKKSEISSKVLWLPMQSPRGTPAALGWLLPTEKKNFKSWLYSPSKSGSGWAPLKVTDETSQKTH